MRGGEGGKSHGNGGIFLLQLGSALFFFVEVCLKLLFTAGETELTFQRGDAAALLLRGLSGEEKVLLQRSGVILRGGIAEDGGKRFAALIELRLGFPGSFVAAPYGDGIVDGSGSGGEVASGGGELADAADDLLTGLIQLGGQMFGALAGGVFRAAAGVELTIYNIVCICLLCGILSAAAIGGEKSCRALPALAGEEEKRQRREQGRKLQPKVITRYVEFWCDYIDAAKYIGYNLKNDVFLLPKDLMKAHDKATETQTALQKARRAKEAGKKETARLKSLAKSYTYTDGRWLIRPPLNADEIVAEGKALKHCVGGYADRHINGNTTILFLRDRERPGKPLVTIEFRGGKIIQIHGWDDERTPCKANPKQISPREIYKDFLDGWLAWIEGGSKRDKQGYPVISNKKKEATVA